MDEMKYAPETNLGLITGCFGLCLTEAWTFQVPFQLFFRKLTFNTKSSVLRVPKNFRIFLSVSKVLGSFRGKAFLH